MSAAAPATPSFDWPGALRALLVRTPLDGSVATAALEQILTAEVPDSVVGAFLMGLRAKGESIDEMLAFATVMRSLGAQVDGFEESVDTCGTGGDNRSTFNVSTTAAFIVAGAGVKVSKHGGRAASSMSGSADVLEELGVRIDLGPIAVAACIKETGMGFCFAPIFHPAMAKVAPLRRELKVATVFNFLGPVVNPARARYQLVGISDPALMETMIGVLHRLGSVHAMAVHSLDGLDEISTCAPTRIVELVTHPNGQSEVLRWMVDPLSMGFKPATLLDLRGGTTKENAQDLVGVLEGVKGPKSDIALLNAGAAIYVAGAAPSVEEGISLARASVSSGRALAVLEGLRRVSNLLSA